jgi:hypothetical protein
MYVVWVDVEVAEHMDILVGQYIGNTVKSGAGSDKAEFANASVCEHVCGFQVLTKYLFRYLNKYS